MSGAPPSPRAAWPAERLRAWAERYGTPVFLYDFGEVRRRVNRVRAAFGPEVDLLYAVKANPMPALLARLTTVVDGLDVASGGEIAAARRAGFAPERLRLAGPGKDRGLLETAVFARVPVSVESVPELLDVAEIARRAGRRAPVMLRLEPRVPRRAFAVQMGTAIHPFGLDADETVGALGVLRDRPRDLELRGIHVYPGSQCRSVRAWTAHLAEVLDLAAAVAAAGFAPAEVNMGGGFGVATPAGPELHLEALGRKAVGMIAKLARAWPGPTPPRFVLELGRFLVADAGLYLTRVLRTKQRHDRTIAVLDGGVHHLWAATGQLGPRLPPFAVPPRAPASPPTELMGPLCTPLDHLGAVPTAVQPGDLIALPQAGAYGATLSPVHFLGHGPPQEALVEQPQADE